MTKNILVIAAHPDDEVLGCGGTMAKHSIHGDNVGVLFIADGVGARNDSFEKNLEKRKLSAESSLKILGAQGLGFFDLPDNRLDTVPLLDIVQKIEKVIKEFKPCILYTHHYGDLNVDHSIVSKASITACRATPDSTIETILFYEVVSSTYWGVAADFFKPNYFNDITSYLEQKRNSLLCYNQEMRDHPNYRSFESVNALATYRGGQAGLWAAEAFELFRSVKR